MIRCVIAISGSGSCRRRLRQIDKESARQPARAQVARPTRGIVKQTVRKQVTSYVLDEVETLSPRELERLQVERQRAGIDRILKTIPFSKGGPE